MAKTDWQTGDELTAAAMNALGQAVNEKAERGEPGPPGEDGADGQDGAAGSDGNDGQDGAPGASAWCERLRDRRGQRIQRF